MATRSKLSSYHELVTEGKIQFQCDVCCRTVSTKDNILKHLCSQHGFSPVKSVKKLYMRDGRRPIPRRTLSRWKHQKDAEGSLLQNKQESGVNADGQVICNTIEEVNDNISEKSSEISWDNSDWISSGSSSEDEGLSSSSSDAEEEAQSVREDEPADAKTKAVKLLQCFRRHNLPTSACKDILKTVKCILPELGNETQSLLCYEKLMTHVPQSSYEEILYCSVCELIVPPSNNDEEIKCPTADCRGKIKSFMIANLKALLSSLLNSPGIFEDILKTIQRISGHNETTITDIYNAELYKNKNDTCDTEESLHLTAVMNTDGVNLYSSSKIELWPVFLAINELNPKLRFARENLLVLGLWQGKGKPPFKQYFAHVSKEVNALTIDGMDFEFEGKRYSIFLSVLCITMDLPAKAAALNMTQYNGTEACITCEEPGVTVAQGRGHSRSYPYRKQDELFPIRTNSGVIDSMRAATANHRLKGFKGLSGLANLHDFDIVLGLVPDYMHAVLLGVVKTIMSKWFSSCQSGKEHFIGKELSKISERLMKVKPPHYIERLPRDLEKHYAHFKATELQSFLLYYALPCLHGIHHDKYLQHFALLSEGIFILLGDEINDESLERSELLLDKFYCQFSEMNGPGSCGLNVHNVCRHMPMYVKKLGPLWSWSCFPFEDGNAMLLSSVHGTGDVVKQSLRNQSVSLYSRSFSSVKENQRKLKVTHVADNCEILGSVQPFRKQLNGSILQSLGVESGVGLRRIQRICINNEKFYSAEYARMKRRFCHAVIYSGDKFGLIQNLVMVINTNKVYAVINKMSVDTNSWVSNYEAGRHLKPMQVDNDIIDVVPAEYLQRTVLYIEERGNSAIVVNLPNKHGHSVFK